MTASTGKAIAALAAAAMTAVGLLSAAPAVADPGWGINGTYQASSNGAWAKINDRYQEQPGELQTWNISTQCSSPSLCNGTVTSNEGWTAPIYTTNGLWLVKRAVPNWRFCEDGVPVEGLRIYKFYPVNESGFVDATYSSGEFAGENYTVGPSGSCGRNAWPTVRIPFYMKTA
ncbi:Rv2253/PknI dimerization domain-containing protein [Mycolicibacterium fallax]|uniref:Uncharacterized protein n=1 Tax=Mycolicibacterium fallax TaxID=1793 RepID=A0A1X1RIM6_MYCFA|nr:hypothetical protein [Mycolicibacterium fallax]ORV06889.1 hypothetical protein AWC04_04450 [Mycolicibacterium fallax]BBY96664.1 hypothetical protein MFAL_01310 [Mycolicibacterium fallax]HOW94968.1 hypothetical protein [Mycolicibacterium fallax]HSA39348.1 hypothetical protein [Mycobacterium sp.]